MVTDSQFAGALLGRLRLERDMMKRYGDRNEIDLARDVTIFENEWKLHSRGAKDALFVLAQDMRLPQKRIEELKEKFFVPNQYDY